MRIQKRQGKERRDGNPSVSSTVGMRECVREKERQRERERKIDYSSSYCHFHQSSLIYHQD